jgi:hypothetical protein
MVSVTEREYKRHFISRGNIPLEGAGGQGFFIYLYFHLRECEACTYYNAGHTHTQPSSSTLLQHNTAEIGYAFNATLSNGNFWPF